MQNDSKINIPEKDKKKLVIVANSSWNIYNFRRNVIRHFINFGYKIVVIAPIDEFSFYQNEFSGLVHYPVKWLNRSGKNIWKDVLYIYELLSIYKKENPDLAIHYTIKPNIYGAIAAKLAGVQSIAIITGLGYSFIHHGLSARIARLLYKLTSRFNSKYVFENIEDRKLFIQAKIAKEDNSISIKGCGVDTDFFSPNGVTPDNRSGKFTFTLFGRMLYDKGVREFVEAAEIVKQSYPKAEFWLVGDIDRENPAAVKEKDLIKWKKSKAIKHIGYTNEIKKIIGQSDCIVLPSYREAIPRTLTESMAMEKPIITTDVPGCNETVIDNSNGFLVPVEDSIALSEAMIQFMLLSVRKRKDMGIAGRAIAIAEFDDKKIAKEIYSFIVGKSSKNRIRVANS